jgi:SanA protein
MMSHSHQHLYWVLVPLVLAVGIFPAVILVCHLVVNSVADDYCYDSPERLPASHVGVLLGTSKYTTAGTLNPYYLSRLEAAKELFASGKIQSILVSGYKTSHGYDEPKSMRDDLIRKGVPGDRIWGDDRGDRTFDSILRLRKVFKIDTCVVISQRFHIERAVYIGRRYGMVVNGYAAEDNPGRYGFGQKVRELLARVRAVIDVELLHAEPSSTESSPDETF